MSSYKGLDLFGSGPHRFSLGRQGQQVLSYFGTGTPAPGTFSVGVLELEVVVRGRLVAVSEAGLWALRDAVAAEVVFPLSPGELVDGTGRSFAGMSLVRWAEGDRVDRGRVRSVGYEAVFRRFVPGP